MQAVADQVWAIDSGAAGPSVCLSFGVHGNERSPIDAGLALRDRFANAALRLLGGRLLLVHANPRASQDDQRWSEGGVDLNRCFHPSVLGREPQLYEEQRAQELVQVLKDCQVTILVDFHCTVEPGERFLMQHPPVDHAPSKEIYELLSAEVLISDPQLNFGGVSLDEWVTTRGHVGICYETGWIQDPDNTAEFVVDEMLNVLLGLQLIEGTARRHAGKSLLRLDDVIPCEEEGFRWAERMGDNLQELSAGAVLGSYKSGRGVTLGLDATLVFPKKRPELVQIGKPLVYLARQQRA
jgi:predicted deacylase